MIKFNGQIAVLRWNDTTKTKKEKMVSMLSTIHTGEMKDTTKRDRKTNLVIKKPDVIVDYNTTMGGVDLLIRVLIPYSSQRCGIKWYRKLAEMFFDITIYNAYIIYKKLNPERKISHLEFRKQLINELISFHCHGTHHNKTGRKNSHPLPLRLIERHFAQRYRGQGKKKNPQISCVVRKSRAKRKDTTFICPICDVGLCIIPCFEMYHTVHNYAIQSSSSSEYSSDNE